MLCSLILFELVGVLAFLGSTDTDQCGLGDAMGMLPMQSFSPNLPPATPVQSDVYPETPSRLRPPFHRQSRYPIPVSSPHDWASSPNNFNIQDQLNAILGSQKKLIDMYHNSSDRVTQNEKKVDGLEKKIDNLASLLEKTAEKVNNFVHTSDAAVRVAPDLSVRLLCQCFFFLH